MKNISFKIFFSFSSKEKKFFYFLLFLMLIGMLLETLSIGLVFPLLSFVLDNNQESYLFEFSFIKSIELQDNFNQLISLKNIILFIIFVFVLKNIYLLYQIYFQAKFSSFLGINKSQSLYKKYVASTYAFHIENNSGFLLRNITEEVGNYCGAVIVLMRLISEIFVLTGIVILLVFISPIITFSIILFFFVTLFVYQKITKKFFLKWGEQKQNYYGKRIISIQQTFGAFKELKILNRFKKFYDSFKFLNSNLYNINVKNETLVSVPKFLIETLMVIIICLILIYFSLINQLSSSIPLLGLMAAASFRILPSVNKIINHIQELRYFNASLQLVVEEFNHWERNKILQTDILAIPFNSKINFTNVSFSYKNKKIFDNLNINIDYGSFIGIYGESGSGKSTFLDLLIGLHKPQFGNIKVDECEIHRNLFGWFKNIGYVPQNVFLIDDSIKNNIALGINEKKINNKKLDNAIRNAGLADFIKNIENGVETIVGENGVTLSGGQKQRIGIARALYNDPKLLILDEATSSLDEINEKNILEYILKLKNKITIIIVSHNKINLIDCDKTYMLKSKKLILTNLL